MADNYNESYDVLEDPEAGFEFKQLWTIFVLNWYWILLSLVLCLGAARLYLRYTNPIYSSSMKILIKDEDNSRGKIRTSGIISANSGFDNELQILVSSSIATRVVKNLHLYVSYVLEGRLRDMECYKNSPVLVDMLEKDVDALPSAIHMVIKKNKKGFHVKGSGCVQFNQDFKELPGTIQTAVGPIMLQNNPGFKMDSRELRVSITPPAQKARGYVGKVKASEVKGTSVARVTMTETQPKRALDYLSELLVCYNVAANEDKNESARKSEEFINERIKLIRQELDSTEINLEQYKKDNKLINLANNATNAFGNTNAYQRQQVELQTQVMLLQSMIEYFDRPENVNQVIPSNLGLTDAGINSDVAAYNEKVVTRNRLVRGSSDANPAVIKLNEELEILWNTIKESLHNAHKIYDLQSRTIASQYNLFNGQVNNTPTQERTLTNIGRQQDIKANLYMMLLQKNEENYISLASTASKARLVDAPVSGGQISPNNSKVYGIAAGVGTIIPFAIAIIFSFLRYRIEGREDVEKLTRLPIICDIPLNHELAKHKERAIVVCENTNNLMEETFRGLRSNLRFVLNADEKVIACTSAIPGEGKTFVSTNLAMSLALLGKKVLIMGLDIRKPRLVKLFGLKHDKRGITSFLAHNTVDFDLLDAQVTRGVLNPNLDVIPSGIVPPNPAELLSSFMLDEAINHFRQQYDYILLDTPPVGLVSDTLDLGHNADMTLFVCRADFSLKTNFGMINNIARDKKLPKVNLVLNGVDLNQRKYAYYYGYGKYSRYGYGKYSRYGHYGLYGHYGHYGMKSQDGKKSGSIE